MITNSDGDQPGVIMNLYRFVKAIGCQPVLAPIAGPVCDVITAAKCDLKTGEMLDGIGGFTCYGLLENSEVCQADNLLPMGLSQGCRLKRDIHRDQIIT